MDKTIILGIKLENRVQIAVDFQNIVTKYGCNIKTRLGLHPVSEGLCSPSGVVLLELIGDKAILDELEAELRTLSGADIQKMTF